MIFDTHCHLNDEALKSRIDTVIEDAKKVGVNKFLVIGWDKESSIAAVKLAEQHPEIYAAIGFHPSNVFDVTEKDFEEVMSYVDHPKVLAIGEIGLDYYWNKEIKDRKIQKEFFIRQINFANEHHKPISIHNRDAFADCLEILSQHRPLWGGVMHCYSGSVESLPAVLNLGLMIGLGGTLTFTNAKKVKEVCENTPLEMIVVETDSPYLSPHPLRGTINEPKNIVLVIDEIVRIKKLSKKHILEKIYENSCEMFHV
ncbi:MAG TPA: TatD family hydrolase [Bacilli bacterium]|nr:TatD family hydrolase [Bacilli bacterium]